MSAQVFCTNTLLFHSTLQDSKDVEVTSLKLCYYNFHIQSNDSMSKYRALLLPATCYMFTLTLLIISVDLYALF